MYSNVLYGAEKSDILEEAEGEENASVNGHMRMDEHWPK